MLVALEFSSLSERASFTQSILLRLKMIDTAINPCLHISLQAFEHVSGRRKWSFCFSTVTSRDYHKLGHCYQTRNVDVDFKSERFRTRNAIFARFCMAHSKFFLAYKRKPVEPVHKLHTDGLRTQNMTCVLHTQTSTTRIALGFRMHGYLLCQFDIQ